jgi:hypothetical protein
MKQITKTLIATGFALLCAISADGATLKPHSVVSRSPSDLDSTEKTITFTSGDEPVTITIIDATAGKNGHNAIIWFVTFGANDRTDGYTYGTDMSNIQ